MNRKLWENLAALLSVHALNYIAPLLTLPLLARVLGPGNWGKLAFAEAYANYISLIIEYGFGLSATREVAQSGEDIQAQSRLLTGVLTAQGLLTLGAAFVTLAIIWLVPSMHQYASLLLLALLLATFRAVAPLWYFQGLERMRFVAGVNIAANLCSAAIIVAVVHSPSQTWVPLAVRATAALFAALAAFGVVYKNIHFTRPTLPGALQVLREGWAIFLFRSAVSLYTTGNVILIGILAPSNVVAWFAGAERIVRSGNSVFMPITQTFYPRISKLLRTDPAKARRTARTSLRLTLGAGVAGGSILFTAAPLLIKILLGPDYGPSVPVLRCLSLLPPLIAASTVLGVQWMLPLRLDKAYTKIIFLAGLVNITLGIILTPIYKQIGMAFSVTAAELFVTIAVLITLRRNGLDPWSTATERGAIEASFRLSEAPTSTI